MQLQFHPGLVTLVTRALNPQTEMTDEQLEMIKAEFRAHTRELERKLAERIEARKYLSRVRERVGGALPPDLGVRDYHPLPREPFGSSMGFPGDGSVW